MLLDKDRCLIRQSCFLFVGESIANDSFRKDTYDQWNSVAHVVILRSDEYVRFNETTAMISFSRCI
jgi:hypothetical protein